MKIGDNISFSYLKGKDVEGLNPKLVDYSAKAENYQGTIEEIRNIENSPLSDYTVSYGKIKGERSTNLVTVELQDGDVKAFYDGRMVGRRVISPTSK
tara:strand:- start:346 stop:636 length:291 start_codon:yes stop_codon:yes gene_type:complete